MSLLSSVNVSINNSVSTNGLEGDTQAHLAFFSVLFLASLLMTLALKAYHNQNQLELEHNILLLLQARLTATLPAIVMTTTLLSFVRLSAGPLPYAAAEVALMIVYMLICHLILLMIASSALQLMLVANFGLVFSLDPQQCTHHVVAAAATMAILPNLAFTAISLRNGSCCSSSTVAYMMGGHEGKQFGLSPATAHMMAWLVLSLILILLVVLGIPVYLKKAHSSLSIRNKKNKRL
jgi:hypothetical protein